MAYESKDKMVSHPAHYNVGGFEVIDIAEAFTANLKGIEASDTKDVIKYVLRWDKKGQPVRDLEKAMWHLTHLLERVKLRMELEAEMAAMNSELTTEYEIDPYTFQDLEAETFSDISNDMTTVVDVNGESWEIDEDGHARRVK